MSDNTRAVWQCGGCGRMVEAYETCERCKPGGEIDRFEAARREMIDSTGECVVYDWAYDGTEHIGIFKEGKPRP